MRNKDHFFISIRNILAAASTITALIVSTGIAQSSEDHVINISGFSPETCILPTGAQHTAELDRLTDDDGKIELVTFDVTIGEMSCNHGITLALQTQNGALTRSVQRATFLKISQTKFNTPQQ